MRIHWPYLWALGMAVPMSVAACGDSAVHDDGEDGPGEDGIPWQVLQGELLVTSRSANEGLDVLILDATQRAVRTVATGLARETEAYGGAFALAPDRGSVTYPESDLVRSSDLWSIPVGSEPIDCSISCGRRLVATEDWEWGPAWSRDGRLAYTLRSADWSGIVVDGERAHADTLWSTEFVRPAWAPDGTLVAPLNRASSLLYRPDLYRLDPETREATLLIPDIRNGSVRHLQGWAVSPRDGRLAYFDEFDGGIWVADPDGQNARQVASGHSPVWSPDGSEIAFMGFAFDEASQEVRPAIQVVDAEGGTPVLVLVNATVRDWR